VSFVGIDHTVYGVEIAESKCVAIQRRDGQIPDLHVPQAEQSYLPVKAKNVNRFPLILLFHIFTIRRQPARRNHCPRVKSASCKRRGRDPGNAFPRVPVTQAQGDLIEGARIEAGLSLELCHLGGDVRKLRRILGQEFWQRFIEHSIYIDKRDRGSDLKLIAHRGNFQIV